MMLLWIGIDTSLLFTSRIPISNHIWRSLAHAPTIQVNGTTLMYNGTMPVSEKDLKPYRKSDEGIQLFEIRDIPDAMIPPWIYIPIPNSNDSYRYSFPSNPFKI